MASRAMQAAASAAALAVAFPTSALPQAPSPPTPWLSGARFERQLEQGVGLVWSGQPLREGLFQLSQAQHVAVFLDRRVDPGQPVTLTVEGLSLQDTLTRIAGTVSIGTSYLGPVVVFAPESCTRVLRTVAAIREAGAERLPGPLGRRLLAKAPLHWDDFAEPRAIVQDLAALAETRPIGLEQIPHDLWAAADLPALSLTDRLTLVLAQFDLTFEITDGTDELHLFPIPQFIAIERRYPAGPQPQDRLQKFLELAPSCTARLVDDEIVVEGLLEDHERLARPPRQRDEPLAPAEPVDLASVVIPKLKAEAALRVLLDEFRKQWQLEIVVDEQALAEHGIRLDDPISVDVRDATIDQAIAAVLAEAGLSFRRDDRTVTVFVAPGE